MPKHWEEEQTDFLNFAFQTLIKNQNTFAYHLLFEAGQIHAEEFERLKAWDIQHPIPNHCTWDIQTCVNVMADILCSKMTPNVILSIFHCSEENAQTYFDKIDPRKLKEPRRFPAKFQEELDRWNDFIVEQSVAQSITEKQQDKILGLYWDSRLGATDFLLQLPITIPNSDEQGLLELIWQNQEYTLIIEIDQEGKFHWFLHDYVKDTIQGTADGKETDTLPNQVIEYLKRFEWKEANHV